MLPRKFSTQPLKSVTDLAVIEGNCVVIIVLVGPVSKL